MFRTATWLAVVCLILSVTESRRAGVAEWHPRAERSTGGSKRILIGGEGDTTAISDELQIATISHDSGANTFEAEIIPREGCKFVSAGVKSGGTATLTADCEDAKLALLSSPPAVVPQALAGSYKEQWQKCETCNTCHATIPTTEALTKNGWVEPRVPDADGHCEECGGCSVSLYRLPSGEVLKGKKRKVFLGASGAGILMGNTTDGTVIVKMWCGLEHPYHQAEYHKHPVPLKCSDDKIGPANPRDQCPLKGGKFGYAKCNFEFLNALQALYDDANLTAITPRTWTAPLISTLPGPIPTTNQPDSRGKRVSTSAQFYHVANGVAIEAFLGGTLDSMNYPLLKSIPPDQVRLSAIADLLFAEADRHGQNVFITEEGNIQLIDNEGAFGPTNSMFLPGTQKYEIYRIGYNAVCCGNLPPGNCPGKPGPASPEHFLDYRCHVEGGKIGIDYPPGVMEFLEQMEDLSVDEIHEKYKMTRKEHAVMFKQRTTWMREFGFEETLDRVLALQPKGNGVNYGNNFSYPIVPPCCDVFDPKCNFRGGLNLRRD